MRISTHFLVIQVVRCELNNLSDSRLSHSFLSFSKTSLSCLSFTGAPVGDPAPEDNGLEHKIRHQLVESKYRKCLKRFGEKGMSAGNREKKVGGEEKRCVCESAIVVSVAAMFSGS